MEFPLLKLAFIPVEIVVQQLYIDDLFKTENLARLSRRFQRVTRLTKLPITGFSVEFKRNGFTLDYLGDEEEIIGRRVFSLQEMRINVPYMAMLAMLNFPRRSQRYYSIESVREEMVEVFSLYKNPTIFDIKIDFSSVDFDVLTFLPSNECERLNISYEDAIDQLKNLKVSKYLRIECSFFEDFDFDFSTISIETIVIKQSEDVITRRALNRWNCEFTELKNSYLELREIESFVGSWLRIGNNVTLLKIHFEEKPEGTLNLEKFGAKKWDPKKRSEIYVPKHGLRIWLGEGIDLERADGQLASVLLKDNIFIFAVWHDRFPKAVRKFNNFDRMWYWGEEPETDDDVDDDDFGEEEDEDEDEEEEEEEDGNV